MDGFTQDLNDLQHRLRRAVSFEDVKYIRNSEIAGRLCTIAGFATAWLFPNPLSILLISIGQVTRWALAHHILHRAFDGIEGVPNRFKGSHFGRGWRRMFDWNEWMLPAGFQHEHNVHHVYTGREEDPDVVEANVEYIRTSTKPRWVKYLMALAIALTWRFSYYAPGTFIQLRRKQKGLRATRYKFDSMFMFAHIYNPLSSEGRRFWAMCILPTFISRFVIIPALFLSISVHAALNVLFSVIAAELLTNFYTFVLIASSHTGDDLFRFDVGGRGRPDFYRHQLLGTVNYKRGPAIRDFLQMWINYQIEHHIFPNLPPSQYAACTAEVEAICRKHGVPYRSERLRHRMWRMLDVVVGNTTMQRVTSHEKAGSEMRQESHGAAAETTTATRMVVVERHPGTETIEREQHPLQPQDGKAPPAAARLRPRRC
jgi:fatty acid desaturase